MADRRGWTKVAVVGTDPARSSRAGLVVALRVAVATGLLVGLGSCYGGGKGDMSCNPPPRITSSPPTQAAVGQPYTYTVQASYLCGMWNICNEIEAVTLPPGATAGPHSVHWTPDGSQGNKDFRFTIATAPDDCGDRATQSWVVHVSPAAR